MITITQKDYTILQNIAEKINSEIKAYNETHDIVHQVISVSVSQDDDFIDHYAYFDIETFKTHSADEESLVYDALITDVIKSSGDGSFTAVYKLI